MADGIKARNNSAYPDYISYIDLQLQGNKTHGNVANEVSPPKLLIPSHLSFYSLQLKQ